MRDHNEALQVAETVRRACLHTARQALEDAEISGLFGAGALEAALGAIESLDLESLLRSDPAP